MKISRNIFIQLICTIGIGLLVSEPLDAAGKKSKISPNPLKIESKLIEPQDDPVLRISNELSKIDESIEKVTAEVEASRLKLLRDAQVSNAARIFLHIDQPIYIQSLQLNSSGVNLYEISNVSIGYPGESPKLLLFEGPVVGETSSFELKMTVRKMQDAESQLELPKYSEIKYAFSTINQAIFAEYDVRIKLNNDPEIVLIPKTLAVSKNERGNISK